MDLIEVYVVRAVLTLGKTGLKVSRVGLGGIPIQRVDAEAARKLLDAVGSRARSNTSGEWAVRPI